MLTTINGHRLRFCGWSYFHHVNPNDEQTVFDKITKLGLEVRQSDAFVKAMKMPSIRKEGDTYFALPTARDYRQAEVEELRQILKANRYVMDEILDGSLPFELVNDLPAFAIDLSFEEPTGLAEYAHTFTSDSKLTSFSENEEYRRFLGDEFFGRCLDLICEKKLFMEFNNSFVGDDLPEFVNTVRWIVVNYPSEQIMPLAIKKEFLSLFVPP